MQIATHIKSTHRPGQPGAVRFPAQDTSDREETTGTGWPELMAVGAKTEGHGSGPLHRYVFRSCLRNGGGGFGQFWHEDVRILDLDGSRDATHHPVLDTLRPAPLVNGYQLRNLGRPPKAADQFSVMRRCSHDRH